MRRAQEAQTILFSDIRSYSAFTAKRGDEEAFRLSTALFAFAREQVTGSNGRMVKTYGDGVMEVSSSPKVTRSGARGTWRSGYRITRRAGRLSEIQGKLVPY